VNVLLTLSLLGIIAYLTGFWLDRMGIPKILGYIFTGIIFSPNTLQWIPDQFLNSTEPLLAVSLAFIAFEVGGELRWKVIKKQEKEIMSITFMAGILPLLLITGLFYLLLLAFPNISPFSDKATVLAFSILIASLASPTDPAATLAIVHQYKAKGIVKDTILGIAALDDALGIVIFSIAIAVSLFVLDHSTTGWESTFLFAGRHILGGIVIGLLMALTMKSLFKYLSLAGEGQQIVIIFSLIMLCYGLASALEADEILASMVMGIMITNTSKHRKKVFQILERYTEELILLLFFILSGLHLDIGLIPETIIPITLYVFLRITGKYAGSYAGSTLVSADEKIKKYTAGGLIPQGGMVIGLALILNQYSAFSSLFDILLTIVMGATIINEIIGPILAKYSLQKAGEIEPN
jgi:NhaP-type Na+/H+ or K+/H+ antiporter